nr:DUF4158 domain-containing protein [Arthrobacter cavernae]
MHIAVAGVRAGRGGLGAAGGGGPAGGAAWGGSGRAPVLRTSGEDPHGASSAGGAVSGWRAPAGLELQELDEFLLARAMEHDSPALLFRLACEYLISARVIRPGPVMVVKRVAHARELAR